MAGHLWTLIEAYLDRQGTAPQASLARKIGLEPQTIASWKNRGSRPRPATLRALAQAIDVDYRVVLAAADADSGYYTDPELDEVLANANISDELRQRIREHASQPVARKATRLRKAE